MKELKVVRAKEDGIAPSASKIQIAPYGVGLYTEDATPYAPFISQFRALVLWNGGFLAQLLQTHSQFKDTKPNHRCHPK